jgi:hypothetical protein
VCFELLWSTAGSPPLDYNSLKAKAIFLPNQWAEMHLLHFLLNKCFDKPKLVTIYNFKHLLFIFIVAPCILLHYVNKTNKCTFTSYILSSLNKTLRTPTCFGLIDNPQGVRSVPR